jgi:hypothetical protein
MNGADSLVTNRLVDLIRLRRIDDTLDIKSVCNLITCLSYAKASESVAKEIVDKVGIKDRKMNDSEGLAIIKAIVRIMVDSEDKIWWRSIANAVISGSKTWGEETNQKVEALLADNSII